MHTVHTPVLLKETIEFLNINPDGVYIDATIGTAGHSKEIIKKLSSKGLLIGIDFDQKSISIAKEVLREYSNVRLYYSNFMHIPRILRDLSINSVSGILFDLGMSNLQLTTAERGFSFQLNGPLDMRMDTSGNLTAEYVVNKYSIDELRKIFYAYGEEKYAYRVAKNIVKIRKLKPIKSTNLLADIVKSSVPSYPKRIHPATKIFQALRIYVNKELDNLKEILDNIWTILNPTGRLVVISFHSLEDRIVKQSFKKAKSQNICNIITPKPVVASIEETRTNTKARSAKLRVSQKI